MAKNNIVKISNSLIEAFVVKNNLGALKILFYIARSNNLLSDNKLSTLNIDTKELCSYCNLDIKTLRRNIKQMQEVSITFRDKKDIEYISVIPRAKFNYGGTLEVDMYRSILHLISEVKNKFTVIDVQNLMKLQSKHSVRMIQLLEMINGFGKDIPKRKRYTLDELNGMFGTKYARLKEFERKILAPVKLELDSSSKLSFVYTLMLDKENISSPGRPKATGIILDLVDSKHVQLKLL